MDPSKSMDQAGKVANPGRGQLNRENTYFCTVITCGIPPEFRKTAIRHRVRPEFIGSRNCVPMAFTAESPPAQGQ